jgi:hypothetical protein
LLSEIFHQIQNKKFISILTFVVAVRGSNAHNLTQPLSSKPIAMIASMKINIYLLDIFLRAFFLPGALAF